MICEILKVIIISPLGVTISTFDRLLTDIN
jgi:hypothetical protein